MGQGRITVRAAGVAIVVFALVAAAFSGRELVASYHASRDGAARIEGLERAARISPSNWRYPLELASIKQAMGLHAEAGLLYRQAISQFEGCGLCWVGLAETEAALGRDPGASLAKARRFGRQPWPTWCTVKTAPSLK